MFITGASGTKKNKHYNSKWEKVIELPCCFPLYVDKYMEEETTIKTFLRGRSGSKINDVKVGGKREWSCHAGQK